MFYSICIYSKAVFGVFLFLNIMYMASDSVQYFIRLGQYLKTETFHITSDLLASLERTRRSGNTRLAFWHAGVPCGASAVPGDTVPLLTLWRHMCLHLHCVSVEAGLAPDSELPSIMILFFLQGYFCRALLTA